MPKRKIAVIGSTGSIGQSTLKIVAQFPKRFEVVALAAGDKVEAFAQQIRTVRPKIAAVRTPEGARHLKELLPPDLKVRIVSGPEGAEEAARFPEAEVVVAAVVGAAGLRPTLAAVRAGKIVALANKESLVVAGALVTKEARKSGAKLLPVDSEHSALFQALNGAPNESVRRLILTASGGPFFPDPKRDLSRVTREEALAHPNWKMGGKITIDSATMMNKGLEIIEAHWLFGFPEKQISVVVHPQSVVHSMVEYVDGSVIAQLGVPDMCGPISYAMAYPERLVDAMAPVNFSALRELTFFDPDPVRFPAIEIARDALRRGESHPAVLNGANEALVAAFLNGEISFTDIPSIASRVVESYPGGAPTDLDGFLRANDWGFAQATDRMRERKQTSS